MSSCPPSASTPSNQTLCQGAIKPAAARPQTNASSSLRSCGGVRSTVPIQCSFPPLKRMRRCQAMTGMRQPPPAWVTQSIGVNAPDPDLGKGGTEVHQFVLDKEGHHLRQSYLFFL